MKFQTFRLKKILENPDSGTNQYKTFFYVLDFTGPAQVIFLKFEFLKNAEIKGQGSNIVIVCNRGVKECTIEYR